MSEITIKYYDSFSFAFAFVCVCSKSAEASVDWRNTFIHISRAFYKKVQ